MFTHLRQSAQGFFAKLILFALVGMFVLWGIGDVFRSVGGGPANIATVGKTQVSVQEFKSTVERMRQKPQQVLSGLINNALIEQEAASLGIVVGDDAVADFIRDLSEFKGKDGRFDKALYQQMLANSGTSERRFVQDIRHEIAAKLLIGSLTGNVMVPKEAVQSLYKIDNEQRSADMLLISAASDVSQTAPAVSDKEIKAYYDAHPKDFTAPEMRTVSYVVLPLADVQSKIQVSDDEIKRAYEEHKADFHRPEHRLVEQMVFKNEGDAKKISDQIVKGGDFDRLAASADITNKGKLAMGDLTQQDLPAEAASVGVFTLKEGGSSAPVKSDFGWHIFHVVKVTPEGVLSLDEAKADIARDIAVRGAQDTIVKMMNGFEDALAGGATLDKAAQNIGEKVQSLGPFTREGEGPEGKKAALPPYEGFLNTVFTTQEKEHSQAVQATDGSYFLVRVDSIAPEHVRPLAEVKATIEKAVLADKESTKIEKLAETISEQLRAGKKPADALATASAAGLKNLAPAPSGNMTRSSETVPDGKLKGTALPRGLTGELFHLKPQESTHAYPLGDGSYMIATLAKVTSAPDKADPKVTDKIAEDLKMTYMDDILHQYLTALRIKYPVSIHSEALGMMKDEENGE